jgi:hypothetical protein
MTKVITVLLALLVSACATKDPLLKQVERAKEERADKVAEILKEQPKWFKQGCAQIPEIACAMALGENSDLQASEDIAMEIAKGKICDTAGGTVDKVTKTYRTSDNGSATTSSRTSIRSVCDKVDMSGLIVGNKEVVAINDKFVTYVEVKILLEGNSFRDRKERARAEGAAQSDADELLKDLDN